MADYHITVRTIVDTKVYYNKVYYTILDYTLRRSGTESLLIKSISLSIVKSLLS